MATSKMSQMSRCHETGIPLDGLLVVDKPLGCTSMAIVRRVRRAAAGVRTGHAGTLDPMATGIVLCCIGRATKTVPILMRMAKTYEATVDLSAFTDTDDREGTPQAQSQWEPVGVATVRRALDTFVGLIEQRPPAYSAVHINGQRAYQRARRGETFVLPVKTVRIDRIDMVAYRWPNLQLNIVCGKGTYIRSLARDLGQAMGTGGHLASLRRTAVGPYDLSMAVDGSCLSQPITQSDLFVVSANKWSEAARDTPPK